MKTDHKTKAEKSLPKVKTIKRNGRAASKMDSKHLLTGYEHIPVGIVETSPDGKYMDVNEEFCRILGYSRRELLRRGIKDCTHPDDYGLDDRLHEQLITGKIPFYRLEKRYVRKNGGVIWVEMTRTLVCDENGKPLYTMGVVLDISDRKDVERVLRDSVERLRLATGAAKMFMWEWDFQTQTYTIADNFEKVLGFSAGLLPRNQFETLWALSPKEDLRHISENFTRAIENQSDLYALPCRVINPENSQIVWLEISAKIVYSREGKPERMFGVAQNITENKKAQDEIAIISRMPAENPNPVMRLTPEGKVSYANPASAAMVADWLQGEEAKLPEELQNTLKTTLNSVKKAELEIENRGKIFSFTLAPIVEAGYVNLYGKDITERKEAELALRRSESNLRNFLENASVGIHWVDRNGIIIWANRAELDMLGYAEEEYIGRPIADFHVDQPVIEDILKRLKNGETLNNYEARLCHKDGSIRYGVINSNVFWENREFIHTRCFTRDITERKLAEEKLRESEERFRALVNQATAGIAESDLESRLVFVNPGFCEMLGYSETELLGKTIWELTHTEDLEENKRLFKRMLEQGKSYQFEKRFIRKDGALLWTSVSVTTIHDLAGKPKGGVGVVINIEKRKQAENELTKFARQQEALYKLSDQLHHTEALADVFDAALDAILNALQCDRASILLFDHTNVMRFVAWRGLSDAYRKATDGHSPWTSDTKDPQPVMMDDVRTADLTESLKAVIQGEGISSLAFIPLVSNGKLIGKFMVYFNTPHVFDEGEIDLGLIIARQLAAGIDRKRAEEKLRESEERYRVVVESQSEMLCRFRPDGTILFVNGAYARARGTTAEELINHNFWEFIAETDRPTVKAMLDRLTPDAPEVHIENRFETAEGERWTLWTNRALRFDSNGHLLEAQSSGIDITDRKQAENRLALLAEISEMLRNFDDPYELMYKIAETVGEHLHVKRALFNEIDLEHNREIVHSDYHNRLDSVAGIHRVSDYSSVTSAEVAAGRTVVNTDAKTDPRTAPDYERTYAISGERAYVAVPLMRDNRWVATFWVSDDMPRQWSSEEISLLETVAERTWAVIEKLRLNAELRESEERLRATLETTVVGFATLTTDTRFVEVNDAFCRIVGYSREELLTMDCNVLTHPDYIESTNEHVVQLLDGEISSFVLEKVYIRKDGVHIWVQNSVSATRGSDGKPLSLIVICQDVTERKQAEQALRHNIAFDEAMMNSMGEGLYTVDNQGLVVFMNPAAEKLFGWTLEELRGRKMHDLTHHQHRDGTPFPAEECAELHVLRSGKPLTGYQDVFIRKDGTFFDVTYSSSPLRGEDGSITGLVVVFEDTTEHKRYEHALRKSEERYRFIVENTSDGIWWIELTEPMPITLPEDEQIDWYYEHAVIRQCNLGMARMYGYDSIEEVVGLPMRVLMPRENRVNLELSRQFVRSGYRLVDAESREIDRDGRQLVFLNNMVGILEDGKLKGEWGTNRDITERKRAEEALRESEERYRGIVNQTIGGIAETDLTGRFIMVNDRYCEIIGYPREQLLNEMRMQDITHPDDLPKNLELFGRLIAEGISFEIEKRYVRPDGSFVWVHNSVSVIKGADGRPQSAVAAVIDVTERKRAEERLRASEALYRTIARSIPGGGVYVVDKDFRYLIAEGPVTEAFGLTREMLEGYTVSEVFPGERGERMETRLRKNFAGESVNYETNHNGRVYWTQQAPLLDSIGQAIILTLDITERKRAEEALRQSEERFARFMQHLPGLAWIKDIEGRYIYANAAAEKAFNTPREKLYGMTDEEIFPPETAAQFRQNDQQALAEGKGLQVVETLRQEDGILHHSLVSKFPIPGPDGSTTLIGGTAFDITERLRAEEALSESEERFRAILRQATAGIVLKDPEGRLIFVNQAFCNMMGRTESELLGKTVWEFMHPEDIAENKRSFDRLMLEGVPFKLERRFIRRDGSVIWIDASVSPIMDAYGKPQSAVAVEVDITPRKRSEELLYESERRFREMINALPAAIYTTDAEGRITHFNPAAVELSGRIPELGTDQWCVTWKLYHSDGTPMPHDQCPMAIALKEGRVVRGSEAIAERPDGTRIWFEPYPTPLYDSDGRIVGGINMLVDITERKKTEEALQESEERFRAILRQATAGIVRKDAEGRLIFVNEAFCNMLGRTESELLGKTVWEFMHPEDIAENKRSFDRLMLEGVPFKLERRFIRRDGSVIWIDASVSPIMDAYDKPQSAVAVEVEITARKLAEDALRQLNLQLEDRVLSRTAKLRAVNQTLREEIAERQKVEEALRKSEAAARENEEKLSTLFDLLPVGISFLDPEGQIIQMNSALANILKLSKGQLSDQTYQSRKYIRANGTILSPAEFASQRALAEGKTVYNVETGVILEDSKVVWTSVSAAPVNVADVGAVVVTVDITESKRAERALQESWERLQILSQRLVEVQEEERRAIARELHDRVGQTLAALNINLIIIGGQLEGKVDEHTSTRLNDSMKLVAETIALVRDVMSNLRPAVLDDYGLEAAIESHLNQFTSRYEIQAKFEKPKQPIPRLGPSIEMTFLRIAQEALMNIAKHAQASLVTLSLWRDENIVCMTIQDNGLGIASWQEANRPGSHGLTIMRERAEAFGGNLMVSSVPGKGTKVEVNIPIETNDPSQGEKEKSL